MRVPHSVAPILREHKAASRFSQPSDFVFASATGGPPNHRNVVRRVLEPALRRARVHSLRGVPEGEVPAGLSVASLGLDTRFELLEQPGAGAAHREPRRIAHRLELRPAQCGDEAALDRRPRHVFLAGVVGHIARAVGVAVRRAWISPLFGRHSTDSTESCRDAWKE